MANEDHDFSVQDLAVKRLNQLVEQLAAKGLSQVQIAARASIPPQYLSDIKHGRRVLTELVARRLGEEFELNYEWLMGISHSMEKPTIHQSADRGGHIIWLPFFSVPIEGDPRQHEAWNGAGVEIAGVAAGRVGLARFPYVLQVGHQDVKGRLVPGDLVLISQVQNESAEIHIVRHRKKNFLARFDHDGAWSRVSDGSQLPGDCPVIGHCVGIIWSTLV